MNPKILEFAKQTGLCDADGDFFGGKISQYDEFAELIVRECCDWIDGSPATDAGQLLLTKSFITANLKGHFSVDKD